MFYYYISTSMFYFECCLPLHTHDDLGPLLKELLFGLLVDGGVGVAHHGDQHVEEEDRHHHLEEDEEGLGHAHVLTLLKVRVLHKRR